MLVCSSGEPSAEIWMKPNGKLRFRVNLISLYLLLPQLLIPCETEMFANQWFLIPPFRFSYEPIKVWNDAIVFNPTSLSCNYFDEDERSKNGFVRVTIKRKSICFANILNKLPCQISFTSNISNLTLRMLKHTHVCTPRQNVTCKLTRHTWNRKLYGIVAEALVYEMRYSFHHTDYWLRWFDSF